MIDVVGTALSVWARCAQRTSRIAGFLAWFVGSTLFSPFAPAGQRTAADACRGSQLKDLVELELEQLSRITISR